MLAAIAILVVAALIISALVIVALMLSSRPNHAEDYYLVKEYEVEQSSSDDPDGEASQSSL